MKKIVSIVLSSVMVMSLVACGGGDEAVSSEATEAETQTTEASTEAIQEITYNIGVLAPLTGNAEIYGNSVKNGCEMAISEINSEGGVQVGSQTYTFEMKSEDTTSTVEGADTAYNALKTAGVDAMIGAATSEETLAVTKQADTDNMLLITPSATLTEITEGDTVYRICFTGIEEADSAAQYIVDQNYESFAVIHQSDNAYSTEIYNEFMAKIAELEVADLLVADETYEAGTTDFSAQLTDIQNDYARLVFVPSYSSDAALIVKQARDMGLSSSGMVATDFLGTDGWDGILSQETDSSYLDGTIFMSTLDESKDNASEFIKAYKSAYGTDANQFAADAYDAVYAIKAAMEKAGAADTDAMLGVMKDISVNKATGEIRFDENGETQHEVTYIEIENGKYNPISID